jgi:hypothetical protein
MRKREEQKVLFRHLLELDKYEKRYKMMEIAFKNILEILNTNRPLVESLELHLPENFPKNQSEVESMSMVIENCCFLGDLVLHLPDISYRVLKKSPKWREIVNWSITYTRNFNFLLDPETAKMLDLFNQEINEDQRSADYTNPYAIKKNEPTDKKAKKKNKAKPKKGPRMEL